MGILDFTKIMSVCNEVMNWDFMIFHVHVTLYRLILFDLLIGLVLGIIYKLFHTGD